MTDTTGHLPAPTQAEVAYDARRTAARIEQLLRKHGRSIDPELADDHPHPLDLDDPALAACYAAAARGVGLTGDRAGQPTLRLIFPDDAPDRIAGPPELDEPLAEVRGVNVHAKQVIEGRDRARLERLCKYIVRPLSPRTASRAAPTACCNWSSSASGRMARRRWCLNRRSSLLGSWRWCHHRAFTNCAIYE